MDGRELSGVAGRPSEFAKPPPTLGQVPDPGRVRNLAQVLMGLVDDESGLSQVAADVIAAHPNEVQAWRDKRPGAWGFLAGQGVLAYRRFLGRRLTDGERRALWATLWDELNRWSG